MSEQGYDVYQRRVREMCMIHRDTVYFYGDINKDAWYIEDNCVLPEELQGKELNLLKAIYDSDLVAQDDVSRYSMFYNRIMQGSKEDIHMEEMSLSFHCKTAQEQLEMVRVVCFFKLDDNGLITEITGKFRPLTDQEKINLTILSQFSSDMNPALFIKSVKHLLERYKNQRIAFIQFDVNKFKLINDRYGSDLGDEVLTYIGDSLHLLCNDEQVHTRMSSDQFMIVAPFSGKEEVITFIELLDEKLSHYNDVNYTLTYGVCFSDERRLSVRSYCDEAGLARLSIKGNVLQKIAFYDTTLKSNMQNRNNIEQAEEDALNNHEFVMYLQPKYVFAKDTAKIIGAEALVRWITPDGTIIPPDDFIPLFEQNGFILKVDEYIWECACKTIARWIASGLEPMPISINISRTYLQKLDTVAYISSLVKKYQIPIQLLQLEITETTENEETVEYVEAFKKAGFTMLMDDFGSGYSSLNMLKNTRFDVLKIDRAFLSEFLESNRGKSIVSHIISMSDELGLDTIAEGVETKEQADFLYENGCTVAQGFYFSKPLPLKEFEKLAFA